MTFWDRIQAFLGNPLTSYGSYTRGPRIAGVNINNDSAFQSAVFWACVTYLSKTVAQLPWRVLLERPGGGSDRQDNQVSRLLNRRPNPEMSSFTFREVVVGTACTWGNSVSEIQVDNRNVPVALWPIAPERVQYKRAESDGRMMYQVDNKPAEFWLEASEVFHVRGFGTGSIGLNVVEYAAQSIGWARATELFGTSYFAEGMRPSGVYMTKAKLSPDGYKTLKQLLKSRSGPKRSQEPLIIDGDGSWKQESALPEESQFIQTREHQVDEMCRWFGVPPHKVMHLLRATFSNIEHQSIEVVVDSLTPWAMRLEQEADFKLFGANRQGYYTKLDMKGLLRGDFESRARGYQTLFQMGVVTTNEIRALEDMNPIGTDGDKRFVPMNFTTLDKAGEEQPAPAPALAAPPPEPHDEDRDVRESARVASMVASTMRHAEVIAQSMRDASPPVTHVTVEASQVTIEPQRIDIGSPIVNVAPTAMPAPNVHVEQPQVVVNMEAAAAPMVEVHPPAIHMEATVVNVEPAQVVVHVAAPEVNVAAPSVTVEAPNVNVESPTVNVAAPNVSVNPKLEAKLQERDSRTTFYRDDNGELVESVTEHR